MIANDPGSNADMEAWTQKTAMNWLQKNKTAQNLSFSQDLRFEIVNQMRFILSP